MTHEEIKKLEENTEKYKKVLALVYADGDVSSVERNRLISLKNELGLSDSLCIAMESHFHETADLDKIEWEKLKEIHHCSLCHPDGSIHWQGINHSMLEYIEAGDTYIEASNGSSYTGLSEPFALSIGQSFEELLNEYGEIHIYDAIDDGKLEVFDEYKDLETYLKLRFDIRNEETLKNDYEKLVTTNIKLTDEEISKLADVIENKTYMSFENPKLKEVVFDYGDFRDLTPENKNRRGANGNGIIHIIQRRFERDELTDFQIATLLIKIAEISKTEKPSGYDESKTRAFINKDGLRVILQKNYNETSKTWLVSGYGLHDDNGRLTLEAAETIETGNAQYGYKPDHSRLRNQVGAVIASIDNIRQNQLAVKQEIENIKTEKGIKQIKTQNAKTVYDRAVLKERPNFISDKELITAFTAANYAKNALNNGSQSQMLKKAKNKKLIEIAGNQKLIDAYASELIVRGYTFNVQNTFSETNVTYSRTIKVSLENGKERRLENPSAEYLEKRNTEKSNIQDWEQKYSALSSDKLQSFINEPSFTKDMAQMVIDDFEGNGSPLLIDELGNICDKNIRETEETNAITAYMPSGITSKEIEIIEDFLTRHRDIPAEQRVEFLKLKDTFEEINERLVAKEERQTELERGESTSITRSEKEVIDDYISKVKENLSSSRKNAVEEVFESSKIALKNFSDNEKKIIGQYLFDNGAKDQKSLGNLLKKKVEPEHNHEINRDIERGR